LAVSFDTRGLAIFDSWGERFPAAAVQEWSGARPKCVVIVTEGEWREVSIDKYTEELVNRTKLAGRRADPAGHGASA